MTAQVQDGEHRDQVPCCREEHPVRKIANQGAPGVLLNDGKLKRTLHEPDEDGIDLRLEPEAQARTLALVSKRRLEDLELGFRGDVEPPHLANGAEAHEQLLTDLGPGACGQFPAPVCREALGNDLALPVGDGDVVRMLGNVIPERLDVLDLLVRRELIEAGRRKCRLGHAASIPASRAVPERSRTTTTNWRAREDVRVVRHVFSEADQDGPHVVAQLADRGDQPALCLLHWSWHRVHICWRATGFDLDIVEACSGSWRWSSTRGPGHTPGRGHAIALPLPRTDRRVQGSRAPRGACGAPGPAGPPAASSRYRRLRRRLRHPRLDSADVSAMVG
jgi:hypothetical protein